MLTFVCMLRCWMWDAVPNWLLYSSVLHVRRYADTATFSQFRTGRKRPLPSLAVGVSAGDVTSVRAGLRRRILLRLRESAKIIVPGAELAFGSNSSPWHNNADSRSPSSITPPPQQPEPMPHPRRTFVPPSQRTLLPPCAHSFHAQKKTATPNRDSRLSLTHHT